MVHRTVSVTVVVLSFASVLLAGTPEHDAAVQQFLADHHVTHQMDLDSGKVIEHMFRHPDDPKLKGRRLHIYPATMLFDVILYDAKETPKASLHPERTYVHLYLASGSAAAYRHEPFLLDTETKLNGGLVFECIAEYLGSVQGPKASLRSVPMRGPIYVAGPIPHLRAIDCIDADGKRFK